MDMELKYENYLQNMTPIAQKMAEDIVRVKSEKNDWNKLNHKEKCQILDKSLIDIKLCEEYKNNSKNENNVNRGSLSQFSWFSKSQLDLFKYIDVKPKYVISPQKHEAKEKARTTRKEEEKRQKSHVSKPKNPPPPPPSKRTQPSNLAYEDVSPGDGLPKTGFDFLDNW